MWENYVVRPLKTFPGKHTELGAVKLFWEAEKVKVGDWCYQVPGLVRSSLWWAHTLCKKQLGKNALSGFKHPQSIAVKLDNYTLIKVYFKGWMHSSFSYSWEKMF